MDYRWPGNVRELQNIMERAVLIAEGMEISLENLPEGLRETAVLPLAALDQSLSIENYTKEFIKSYQSSLNEQQLSEKLGITRKALWEKRKRWGLERT